MPANVEYYTGRLPAWHNLGDVVGKFITSQELLDNPRLNFQVMKDQLEYRGQLIDSWGIFRTDTGRFLGNVGPDYTPIQHTEGFKFLDVLVGEVNGAHFETAGSLGNGETIWGLINLNAKIGVKNTEDVVNNYLMFKTGHIGNYTFSFQGCSTRVVCENTLNMALREGRSEFRIRHTPNFNERLQQAHDIIAGFKEWNESVDDKINYLASHVIDRDNMINILDELFPADQEGNRSTRSKNNIEKILNLYESNDGNAIPQIRGTAYNLLNAVTQYVDHERSVKGNNPRSRGESAMFGSGHQFKSRAMDIILAETQNMKSIWTPTIAVVQMEA